MIRSCKTPQILTMTYTLKLVLLEANFSIVGICRSPHVYFNPPPPPSKKLCVKVKYFSIPLFSQAWLQQLRFHFYYLNAKHNYPRRVFHLKNLVLGTCKNRKIWFQSWSVKSKHLFSSSFSQTIQIQKSISKELYLCGLKSKVLLIIVRYILLTPFVHPC